MGARDTEYPGRDDLPVPESESEPGTAAQAAPDSDPEIDPAEPQASVEPEPAPAGSEVLSNDDIENLLATLASGEGAPDAPHPSEPADEAVEADVEAETDLEAMADPDAAEPEADSTISDEPELPVSTSKLLSNDDIDSLLASLTSGKEDADTAMPVQPAEPDDVVIKVEPEALAKIEAELEASSDPPAVEEPFLEAQAAEQQEARDAAEPVTQEMLESLLREARRPDAADPVPESAPAQAPVAKAPAAVDVAPVPTDVPETELKAPRRLPTRLLVSAALGFFSAACLYLFLVTHPYRTADVEALRAIRSADPSRAVSLARGFVESGRYSEALSELEPVMDAIPSGEGRVDAGYLHVEAQYHLLPDEAKIPAINELRTELDRLLAEAPEHPRALQARRWRADLYRRADMTEEAYEAYSEILAEAGADPGLDAVLLDAARLAVQAGRPAEAVDYLRRLIGGFPGSRLRAEAELALGQAYLAAGDRQAGEMMLTSVARSHPDSGLGAEAFVALGNLQYNDGNYDEAIRLFETRLQTATKVEGNDDIYLLLARAHRAKGQLPEAERVLRELIDFFPDSPDVPAALVELSQVLDGQGRRDEAVGVAKQAAEQHAGDADVLANAGRMLAEAGEVSAAAEALLAAERAGAENPRVLLDAAHQWFSAKDLVKAGEALQRVIDEYPDSAEAIQAGVELARVDRERGQVRAALERLEALVAAGKDQPAPVGVLDALATLYGDLGLYERAADLFREIAGATSDSTLLARAALAMIDAGRIGDARTVASRVDPAALPEPLAYRLLMRQGDALSATDPEGAVALMDAAYEQYPDQRTANDVRRVLRANLALGRTAAARGIVMDLDAQVQASPADAPLLERAAACWGDYLYRRGDYRAAEEAYALASAALGAPKSDDGLWSRLQQANCRLQMEDLQGSGRMFEEVAASNSEWRDVARAKADYVKLQLRRRGETLLPAPDPQEG